MNARFFNDNRQRLINLLEGTPVMLTAYGALQRSNDASFAFEQEANFWYLTGIEVADWQLIINNKKSVLVAPEVDEIHAVFDGSLSWHDAKAMSGVDEVISYKEGKALVAELALRHSTVATLGKDPRAVHYDFAVNPAPANLLRQLKKQFDEVRDCRRELAKMRAIKQPEEIEAIRRAIDLSVEAFQQVKADLDTYTREYQVESAFSHYFRSRGAKGHAYDPIVAAGKNACTLHYGANNDSLKKSDMLLLDIGARVDGYAADITRTYSLGDVSPRHEAVHTAVETAHRQIIDLLQPNLKVEDYSKAVDTIMKKALKSLRLLNSDDDYRKYFPHAISHGLGIDVHDSLGGPEVFAEGMVLTVEPGIYIPEEGIGVRIEDDILITHDGHENLSAALPTSL